MENLETDNKGALLQILDGLRQRAESNELLQLFIVIEDAEGFSAEWSGSEDRFAIAGFVLASALTRMGFVRPPE